MNAFSPPSVSSRAVETCNNLVFDAIVEYCDLVGSYARSASEAFLFRRLETLEATRGRFRLNVPVAIPFDAVGQMEIDLLCEEARLAIEIDGGQHLADADAYRRDRHKDQLLQEHGYFVLRFLAEDVGKQLGMVLDSIIRTLLHRLKT